MSIKSRTIKAVKDAATEYAKAAGKVAEINRNELLSTAGKIHEARQIDDQFQAYIEKASQEYSSFMIEAIKAVGQAEAMEQAKRYQDPGYNQALNSVIQQILEIEESADEEFFTNCSLFHDFLLLRLSFAYSICKS